MADYIALQTHTSNTYTKNFSPNKKNCWQLLSKGLFNEEAPSHKIFKENLKKFHQYDENGKLISQRESYNDKYHKKEENDQSFLNYNDEDKENYRGL